MKTRTSILALAALAATAISALTPTSASAWGIHIGGGYGGYGGHGMGGIYRPVGVNHGGFGYYSHSRLREGQVRVKLLRFWRLLGFEFLVNHFVWYRKFWEYYLCYVVRGKAMEFEFEVMK